jgi:hypothetical protein
MHARTHTPIVLFCFVLYTLLVRTYYYWHVLDHTRRRHVSGTKGPSVLFSYYILPALVCHGMRWCLRFTLSLSYHLLC